MKRLATLRIFADHYQFWVYERGTNPFEPLPEYTDETVQRGWARTEHAISIGTQAHLNDHRLDIFRCDDPPAPRDADRVTVHSLRVSTGIAVHDLEESFSLELPPGKYSIVVAAYNLGRESTAEEEALDNAAFLERMDWERYELYVCPPLGRVDGPYS